MGGASGSRGLRGDQLRYLEEKARDALRGAAQPSKRCLFISFAGEDLDEVNLLRGQAKSEHSDLEFIDRSLQVPFDSGKAEYIRRGIRERIRQASVTVCYLTPNSAQSKWVDWEIRESIRLGKGVVAMYPGDTPPKTLPKAIKDYRIELTPWKHEALMRAIEDAAKTR